MRTKHQDGNIYEARRRTTSKDKRGKVIAFHLRYRVTKIVDGQSVRVQKHEKLCDRDDAHFSTTCPAVQELAAEAMKRVRDADHQLPLKDDRTVVEFFERRVLPYCEEKLQTKDGEPRNKPSTVATYKRIWKRHLRDHFGNVTLKRYDPDTGTQFLETLVGTQCTTTLKAINRSGS